MPNFAEKEKRPFTVYVVLGHPERNSFNHAIAGKVAELLRVNGHDVYFHDLYEEKFDPVLRESKLFENAPISSVIQEHCRQLSVADGVVVVHPNWWGQPPAMIKGWIDQVMRPGIAYRFVQDETGHMFPHGLLSSKTILVINTANSTHTDGLLQKIWEYTFVSCGVKNFHYQLLGGIAASSTEQRKEWLAKVKETVQELFPPSLS
ncbi:NAD(P)H-dependent oxidoreductase [Effusibacillus lacus]|uniref:NAD(P)H-dependent oxidoreductase n=1 Tax=Effusibacillus lacus TaxID=1348429 RepID=UPI000BB8F4FC|nr:NAD(P)H-dependent oxidoreductase [Effusibacillus lacus]TCS68170.1 putative NADPH-quinone reductase [Effusibacillus lacus]